MIVNTAQGGGRSLPLNLFVQPDEPKTKDGIWLQTPAKETLKKVIFDENPWAAGQWQNPSLVPNLPYTDVSATCEYNGEIYYTRYNSTTFYKFNPSTGITTQLADYTYANFYPSLIAYKGYIYTFYAGPSQANLGCYDMYDISANTHALKSFITSCGGIYSLACRLDNIAYIFGGLDTTTGYSGSGYDLDFAVKINLDTGVITELPRLPNGRSLGVAIPYNNRIYLFGGSVSGRADKASATCLYYDITSNTYTTIAALPSALDSFGGKLIGDKAYLFGGYSGTFHDTTLVYDFAANKFSNGAVMPVAMAIIGNRTELIGDSIYILGGHNSSGDLATIQHFMLTAKQYAYSPAVIIHRLPKDATCEAMLITSKMCDGVPVSFKNTMLFKDGNLTFPALYVGTGSAWVKEREAQ